jgi:hypothetical protein
MLNKENALLISALKKLDTNELTHIIKHIDSKGIEHLCECVFNTIYTDLKLPKNKRRKIKNKFNNDKSRKNINIITKKQSNILKKRAALLQEGEGLGLILSAIAPLITSLFTR